MKFNYCDHRLVQPSSLRQLIMIIRENYRLLDLLIPDSMNCFQKIQY